MEGDACGQERGKGERDSIVRRRQQSERILSSRLTGLVLNDVP
jgi:hypothetical protein